MNCRTPGLAPLALLALLGGPAAAQVAGRLVDEVSVAEQDGYATVTVVFGCNVQYVSHVPASTGDTLRVRLVPGPDCGSPAAGWIVPPPLDDRGVIRAVDVDRTMGRNVDLAIRWSKAEQFVLVPSTNGRGLRILLVRPDVDDRTPGEYAESRSKARYPSVLVPKGEPVGILSLARERDVDLVGIEEAQFFPASLVGVVERLADAGRTVIVSGLNLDFRGRPFGPMPVLMAMADGVTSLSAICTVCGEEATRTQRLIDGRPAGADEPVVVVGGVSPDQPTARHETYEARCRAHHELP